MALNTIHEGRENTQEWHEPIPEYFSLQAVRNRYSAKEEIKTTLFDYLYTEEKRKLGYTPSWDKEGEEITWASTVWSEYIVSYLQWHWVNKSSVLEYQINSMGTDSIMDDSITVYFLESGKKSELTFSLYSLDPETEGLKVYTSLQEKVEEEAAAKESLEKTISAFSTSIEAMRLIFKANAKNEIFWYLDDEDVLTPRMVDRSQVWLWDLRGKTLLGIQQNARLQFAKIQELRTKAGITVIPENDEVYERDIQDYASMVMGLWDLYEWGAKHFRRSKEELQYFIFERIKHCTTANCLLSELVQLNSQVDRHNFVSDAQTMSYTVYTEMMWEIILARMEQLWAGDKDYLEYAKIVTGRRWDSDTDYETDTTRGNAMKALFKILGRKWGTFDKLYQRWMMKIEDDEIGDRSVSEVLSDYKKTFEQYVEGSEKIWDSLPSFDSENYQELPLEQKIQLSTMARVSEKIKNSWYLFHGVGRWKRSFLLDGKIDSKELSKILQLVESEAKEDIVELIDDNFETNSSYVFWMSSDDLQWLVWLDGKPLFSLTELDVFDLYNEMNGNGVFDWSDNVNNWWVTIGKIVAVVVVSMALTYATAWIAGAGGFAAIKGSILTNAYVWGSVTGLWSAPAWWVIFPNGHDSAGEMVFDRVSDLWVSVATWWFWWHMINKWWTKVYNKQTWNKEPWWVFSSKTNMAIQWIDLGPIGFGTEILRAQLVSSIYQDQDLFENHRKKRKLEKKWRNKSKIIDKLK